MWGPWQKQESAKSQIPNPKPQLPTSVGIWSLGFGLWDLSVVLLEIHPFVQAGHLIAISVEDQRARRSEQRRQARFDVLAMAWMRHRRIDVRIEAVRFRPVDHPRRPRLFFDEANSGDGLATLEAVLPRDDQAERCAVLGRQDLAVHAHRQDR